MNSNELKWWLHGWMELSSAKRFTAIQVDQILDHIAIIEQPDDFVFWLKGTLELSNTLEKQTSTALYLSVCLELDKFFNKITPDRIKKEEIQKAVDETVNVKEGLLSSPIKAEIDKEALMRLLEEARNTVSPISGFNFMQQDPFFHWNVQPICNGGTHC